MLKKSILFLAVLFLVASIFTVYEKRIEANDTKGDEIYFNKKGLSYFNHGFYKLTPKGRQDEASPYYESAIIEFKKAIELNDSYLEPKLNLARVYQVLKNYQMEAELYKRIIQLNPTDIDLYWKLALALLELKQYDDAISQLETAKEYTLDEEIRDILNGYIEKIYQERQDR